MKVCRLKKSENNCAGEFHLSGYAKKYWTMKEGIVPVPLNHPRAENDDDVLPVQAVSHWGEPKQRGETPE
jgi:hypothetical protein